MNRAFRATEFEFRHRFWLIAAFYFLTFESYRWDRVNISVALTRWMLGSAVNVDVPPASMLLRALFILAAVIAGVAALIRTWAGAYLRSDVIHDTALHSDSLLADGPYRYLRNPLYLGTILLAIGIGMLASRLGWVILVATNVIFNYRLIFREESELLRTQGKPYQDFLAAVPRLFPALRPRLPSSGMKPRWREAFQGEFTFWIFFLAMAVFAATKNGRIMFWTIMLALAIYVIQHFRFRKARKSSLETKA